MTEKQLFATVIMPVKNGAETIEAAIASVLQETRFPMELIVVDDSSSDDTLARVLQVSDPRVRVLTNAGTGQSCALNTGIAAAQGNVFMRCDSDDLYESGRIDWQLGMLESNPDLAGVCGEVSAMTSSGDRLGRLANVMPNEGIASDMLNTGRMCAHLGAYAIRLQAVQSAGSFREFFKFSQDYDFLFRVAQHGTLKFYTKPAYTIRFSSGSVCRRTPLSVRRWYMDKAQEFRLERLTTGSDPLQRGEQITQPDESNASPVVERVNSSISDVLQGIAWECFRQEEYQGAIVAAGRAIAWTPLRLRTYVSFSKIILLSVKNRFMRKFNRAQSTQ